LRRGQYCCATQRRHQTDKPRNNGKSLHEQASTTMGNEFSSEGGTRRHDDGLISQIFACTSTKKTASSIKLSHIVTEPESTPTFRRGVSTAKLSRSSSSGASESSVESLGNIDFTRPHHSVRQSHEVLRCTKELWSSDRARNACRPSGIVTSSVLPRTSADANDKKKDANPKNRRDFGTLCHDCEGKRLRDACRGIIAQEVVTCGGYDQYGNPIACNANSKKVRAKKQTRKS
jgi:hypothetical protein